jgi:hypothetical protein
MQNPNPFVLRRICNQCSVEKGVFFFWQKDLPFLCKEGRSNQKKVTGTRNRDVDLLEPETSENMQHNGTGAKDTRNAQSSQDLHPMIETIQTPASIFPSGRERVLLVCY